MKFGGLSEDEASNISQILEAEGISFSVGKDEDIAEFNSLSMKNDLRYYAPPNISTSMIAISIEDESFQRLSETSKAKLLVFGITDQAPSPEDFQPYSGETIHKQLIEGPRRMVAFNFKHQLILGFILLLAYFFLRTSG